MFKPHLHRYSNHIIMNTHRGTQLDELLSISQEANSFIDKGLAGVILVFGPLSCRTLQLVSAISHPISELSLLKLRSLLSCLVEFSLEELISGGVLILVNNDNYYFLSACQISLILTSQQCPKIAMKYNVHVLVKNSK